MNGPGGGGGGQRFQNDGVTDIGTQGGDIYGDVHFNRVIHHHHEVLPGDPPEKRFEAGVEDLRSGKRAKAEELISEAVRDGYLTSRSVYFWMLAILSKRPFEQLGPADLSSLKRAVERLPADTADPEGYNAAAGAVFALFMSQAELMPNGTPVGFGLVQAQLEALPGERKAEILQHLSMLLHKALRDGLDEEERHDVATNRLANDRLRRAPKFFIPDPEDLVPRVAAPPPKSTGRRVALGFCATPAAVGFVWALAVMFKASAGSAALALLLCGAGGYALVLYGPRWRWLRTRRLRAAYEHSVFNTMRVDGSGTSEDVAGRVELWNEVFAAAETWFSEQLRDGEHPGAWRQARLGPQVALANDLAQRYGTRNVPAPDATGILAKVGVVFGRLTGSQGAQASPLEAQERERFAAFLAQANTGTHASAASAADDMGYRVAVLDDLSTRQQMLGWLIRMYARDTADRWRDGTLRDFERKLRLSRLSFLALFAGAAAMALGLLVSLGVLVTHNAGAAAGIVVLIGLGGWSSARVGYPLIEQHLTFTADAEEYARRNAAEAKAYQDWKDYLADRPEDYEMATWLDYDQRAVRLIAFDGFGLSSSEVVNSFFLVEAGDGAKSARVLNGPPRYSAYNIRLFILTDTGLRYNLWPLDFLQGQEGPWENEVFRYDVIATARVTEVGVRLRNGRRSVVDLAADGAMTSRGDAKDLILRQSVQLKLLHGDAINVLVDNFERFIEIGVEDPEQLVELAKDVSGATVAVRILQAVAADGRIWFERQRERLQYKLAPLINEARKGFPVQAAPVEIEPVGAPPETDSPG